MEEQSGLSIAALDKSKVLQEFLDDSRLTSGWHGVVGRVDHLQVRVAASVGRRREVQVGVVRVIQNVVRRRVGSSDGCGGCQVVHRAASQVLRGAQNLNRWTILKQHKFPNTPLIVSIKG